MMMIGDQELEINVSRCDWIIPQDKLKTFFAIRMQMMKNDREFAPFLQEEETELSNPKKKQ